MIQRYKVDLHDWLKKKIDGVDGPPLALGQLDVHGSVYLPTARKHSWRKAKSGVDRGKGSSSFAAVGLGQVVSAELGTAEARFVVIAWCLEVQEGSKLGEQLGRPV